MINRAAILFLLSIIYLSAQTQNSELNNVKAQLKKKEAFKKQVISELTKGPGGNTFVNLTLDAVETIDEVDQMVRAVLANTEMQMPPIPLEQGAAASAQLVPVWVQNFFDEVVNYVITEKGKGEVLPDPPPHASFDYCYPCDADRKERYSRDTAAYLNIFYGEHGKMVSKALQVIRYFQWRKEKGLPYKKEDAERMTEKMNKDIDWLRNAMLQKVLQAWNLYKHNATQLSLLTQLVLSTHRNYELWGIPVPAEFPDLNVVGQQMVTSCEKYFDDAVQRRDYPVVLNIHWFIGLLRQITLLFGEFEVSGKVAEFMETNRFEMLVNAAGQLGGEGQTMEAKIVGSNFYRAIPDQSCVLRWYLYDPDVKKMEFDLEKAELELGTPATYTGTKKWETPPAEILLSFCDKPVRDSLLIQFFNPTGKESWVIGGQAIPGNFIQGIFMNCFMDEKRVRAEASGLRAKEQQMVKEMMEQYERDVKGNEYLMQKDPAIMTPEERERLEKLVAASKAIQNQLTKAALSNSALFKGTLKNNLKTVFKEELDGRALFPSNRGIQFAKFKVELIHVE